MSPLSVLVNAASVGAGPFPSSARLLPQGRKNGPAPTLADYIGGGHWRRAFLRPVALRGQRAGTGPAPTLADCHRVDT